MACVNVPFMCCRACQNLGRYCSKLVYLCLESCAFLTDVSLRSLRSLFSASDFPCNMLEMIVSRCYCTNLCWTVFFLVVEDWQWKPAPSVKCCIVQCQFLVLISLWSIFDVQWSWTFIAFCAKICMVLTPVFWNVYTHFGYSASLFSVISQYWDEYASFIVQHIRTNI